MIKPPSCYALASCMSRNRYVPVTNSPHRFIFRHLGRHPCRRPATLRRAKRLRRPATPRSYPSPPERSGMAQPFRNPLSPAACALAPRSTRLPQAGSKRLRRPATPRSDPSAPGRSGMAQPFRNPLSSAAPRTRAPLHAPALSRIETTPSSRYASERSQCAGT
jgi:hypothetical protein